jgi:RNA polymerase sigma factor (TIGR02999 family)
VGEIDRFMSGETETATTLLAAWRAGDVESGNKLFRIAYKELHKIAGAKLRHESPSHTLQPTALVHELYLRLFSSQPVAFQDRAHFLAVAARNLRHILIEHARAAGRLRRGGSRVQVTLSESLRPEQQDHNVVADFLDLEKALDQLAEIDQRASRVIELRFFAGLSEKEAAAVLEISVAALKRDWTYGRAWLLSRLGH